MHGASALARLTELVPPPASPAATDWDEAERVYRSPFPQGYRRMIEAYGPGLLTWGGLAEQGALHWPVDGPAESWVTVAQDYEFLVFVEIERPADEIVLELLERGLPELRLADIAARPPVFETLDDLLAR